MKFKVGDLIVVSSQDIKLSQQMAIVIELPTEQCSYYQVFLQDDMRIFPLVKSEMKYVL